MGRKGRQNGFTLIEVLLVTLVLGVLASLAAPTIRQFTARAKVSEVLSVFGTCRNMVTETYVLGDSIPAAGDWGCESSPGVPVSQYVDSVTVTEKGVIIATLNGTNDLRLDWHTVSLAPLDGTGNIMSSYGRIARWRCGYGDDGTDLDTKFLPSSCAGF